MAQVKFSGRSDIDLTSVAGGYSGANISTYIFGRKVVTAHLSMYSGGDGGSFVFSGIEIPVGMEARDVLTEDLEKKIREAMVSICASFDKAVIDMMAGFGATPKQKGAE